MEKTVVILQPGYLPWLGFFDMMHSADLFIYHTDVQFDKQSWRNRNRIRTGQGWSWLTVPVFIKGRSHDLIKDIRIDNSSKWYNKHLNLIVQNYNKAPFFEQYIRFFEEVYKTKWELLVDLDVHVADYIKRSLGIRTPIDYSTNYDLEGLKSQERVVALCKQAGATAYISGPAGKTIYSEEFFMENGLRLVWHDYPHPVYQQQVQGFIPYLSVIDLLFNHGPESLEILTLRNKVVEDVQ